ncbi:putative hydroxyacylglutathione hydrolase [Tuber indicum]|nr:putative hydroxyacylglutathione hydrolase [Tuber indicum]
MFHTLFNPRQIYSIGSIITRKMHIKSIPMWTGTSDNYSYLIIDDKTKDAMIVDPAHPPEVLPVLGKEISENGINLKAIINTHHHHDHAGGNNGILEKYPQLQVLGGKDCEAVTRKLADGETFNIGEGITVKSLHTPCHTQDSICYYVEDSGDKAAFTGDTLFIAGCGRFFEGTAEEMHKALNTTLGSLPDDTKVYPGHEYTRSNVRFGKSVICSPAIQSLEKFCEENTETQGKFTIGDEKEHNVFMRVDDPAIQEKTGEKNSVSVIKKLREMKNSFK